MGSEPREGLLRLTRLTVGVALIVTLLGTGLAGAAVPPRVAIIKSSSIPQFDQATDAIVESLKRDPHQPELLTFDLQGDMANSAVVLRHVYDANPSLLITVGSLATAAVLNDGSTLPVVFSMVLYPAQSGFLKNRAGRPVTGASLDVPLDVQFASLRRLLPSARRVGVVHHPDETGAIVTEAQRIAAAHGFTLVAEPVDSVGQVLSTFERLLERVDAIWAVADSHVFTPQTTSALLLAALRRRVPLIGLSAGHVRAGAVAALNCDYADVGKQTAELASRVLRGERVSDLPVAVPRTVLLALNARTAQHLGVTIPPDLEGEAREVTR